MNISEKVCGILTNANTLQINFMFTDSRGSSFFISGPHFLMVAANISSNNITVVEGGVGPNKAVYTARNDGARRANTMYVGQNNNSPQNLEALIVHEAVHAIFDLTRATIPWLDNEIIAYIAQGYYATNAGIPDKNVDYKDYVYLGKMMANDLIAGRKIDDFWLDAIKDQLRNDPDYAGYINGIFVGDG